MSTVHEVRIPSSNASFLLHQGLSFPICKMWPLDPSNLVVLLGLTLGIKLESIQPGE